MENSWQSQSYKPSSFATLFPTIINKYIKSVKGKNPNNFLQKEEDVNTIKYMQAIFLRAGRERKKMRMVKLIPVEM